LSAGTLDTVNVPGGTIKNYDSDIEYSFTTQEAELVAPVLVGTSPANGATDVALDAVITVTFDKAVEANDLSAISLKDATATLPITAGVSGAVLTITPAAGLSAGTLYTVKVPGGTIKNYDTDIEFSFTTLTSGIGSISVNLVRVSQQGDYLVITGSKPGDVITVYNVTGMKIISTADTVIPVSKTGKGVFIVNTGSQNSKVILQ
jgi:hypothetical protein